MADSDIEIPEDISELIDDCDKNCIEAENLALDTVRSIEIPICGALRDIRSQRCYYVLCRIRDWFGSTPTKEHYLCLMMVTDYVSCAYNNTDFYGTFIAEKKDRFYESFFVKLSSEWKAMFHKMPFSVLPTLDKLNMLKNSLRISMARFPRKFTFRGLFTEIMNSCNDYGTKLEEHLSSLKAMKVDVLSNLPALSTQDCKTVVRISSDSKSTSISVPFKINSKPTTPNGIRNLTTQIPLIKSPATPNAIRNLTQIPLTKCNSSPISRVIHEPKKITFILPKETIQPGVVTISDSPVKAADARSSTLNDIINVMPSKACKRPAESCVILKPPNSDDKIMKLQKDIAVSNNGINNSLLRKLNAFDILMRKKVVKSIS
ncbi:uncharacterized protein LOC135845711 [Planococcus citri]|uniref:uncharacterized protein LOC135845711 n=1 Tax=Planococcus citri TaxID=170843 RepID=UPI0031F73DEF